MFSALVCSWYLYRKGGRNGAITQYCLDFEHSHSTVLSGGDAEIPDTGHGVHHLEEKIEGATRYSILSTAEAQLLAVCGLPTGCRLICIYLIANRLI